ncbi:MAG: glycosyltransferase [Pseudomonadota bacterium]
MRTLMLTSTLPRFPGDMQANFVGEQAEAWTKARSQDRVIVLAPGDPTAQPVEDRGAIRVERFRYMRPEKLQKLAYPAILPNLRRNPGLAVQIPPFIWSQYRAAKALVKWDRIDLVYAHWVMAQGVIAWRLKRATGTPYILQNHSSDVAVFEKLGELGKRLARLIIREADHFFCVNSIQREAAASLFEGSEREQFLANCTVLPMGVVLPPPNPKAKREFDVATIGRLSAKKGIHYLIAASERLAEEKKRPVIGIAGDGEEMANLQALTDRADIRFLGFVSDNEKDEFFDRTARFAFPAKEADGDVEGLPVSLLEALCRGMPVLASRDTNIELLPEWNRLREYVVFVDDPANELVMDVGLKRLLELPSTPNDQLIEIMARYRWDRLIEDYLRPIERSVVS